MTQYGTLVGQSTNNARNLVLQPVSAGADYTVTTSLSFPGTPVNAQVLGQTGGLIIYQDDDHFIYLGRTLIGGGVQIQFVQEDGSTLLVNSASEPVLLPQPVYLRLSKTGSLYQASYSYDNQTFSSLGPGPLPTPTATATATGTPTLVATNTSTPTPTGYTATQFLSDHEWTFVRVVSGL